MKTNMNETALRDPKNNWLAQELAYERRLSVWRLDDNAAFLDQEHREHCEAEEIRERHERAHREAEYYSRNHNQRPNNNRRPINQSARPNQEVMNKKSSLVGIFFLVYFIFMFLNLILSIITD